ncbi:MAG: ABC transporter ATP-binding protein [Clostridiales Family XIII bacterium]|jgi:putative ABC transport system ATP-binding protein|nr:ABC transporter ATP-binding protein [Clostridiales Family XIII bacterium]
MSVYVTFDEVTKVYRTGEVTTAALNGASFAVDRGEFCVVVGPSGAGKTTILNILGGIDRCSSGSVVVDGNDIAKMNEHRLTVYRRQDVGFVFQFYNLVQNLTALENVELASEICDNPLNPREVLDAVELSHRIDNFPAQLSGGEQQRVAIARAMAKNPKLMLCDEPTGALDGATGVQILKLLQKMSLDSGMTVILITHNTAITGMAQKVIEVRNGGIESVYRNADPKRAEEVAL